MLLALGPAPPHTESLKPAHTLVDSPVIKLKPRDAHGTFFLPGEKKRVWLLPSWNLSTGKEENIMTKCSKFIVITTLHSEQLGEVVAPNVMGWSGLWLSRLLKEENYLSGELCYSDMSKVVEMNLAPQTSPIWKKQPKKMASFPSERFIREAAGLLQGQRHQNKVSSCWMKGWDRWCAGAGQSWQVSPSLSCPACILVQYHTPANHVGWKD